MARKWGRLVGVKGADGPSLLEESRQRKQIKIAQFLVATWRPSRWIICCTPLHSSGQHTLAPERPACVQILCGCHLSTRAWPAVHHSKGHDTCFLTRHLPVRVAAYSSPADTTAARRYRVLWRCRMCTSRCRSSRDRERASIPAPPSFLTLFLPFFPSSSPSPTNSSRLRRGSLWQRSNVCVCVNRAA